MQVLIIGYGALGKALESEAKRRSYITVIAHNQQEAIAYLQDYPDSIIDTGWHLPNDKEGRENVQLVRNNYWQAIQRIDAARPGTRYIGIGSQAEVEPLNGITMLSTGMLGTETKQSEYGKAKHKLASILLSRNLSSLWVRLGTILHRGMPVDSVYRMAATAKRLPVAKHVNWCAMSIEETAGEILDAALSPRYGIANIGYNHDLREALLLINPKLEFDDGAERHVYMFDARTMLEEDYLRKLGNYWRETAKKED